MIACVVLQCITGVHRIAGNILVTNGIIGISHIFFKMEQVLNLNLSLFYMYSTLLCWLLCHLKGL